MMNRQMASPHTCDGPAAWFRPLDRQWVGLLRLGGGTAGTVLSLTVLLLGILLLMGNTPVLAQGQDNPIVLGKVVDKPETYMGDTLRYTLTVQNVSANGLDGLHLVDPIPAGTGYITDTLTASAGQAYFDGDENQIVWNGGLEPQARAVIVFDVAVGPDNPDNPDNVCDVVILNRATLTHVTGAQIFSPEVRAHLNCPDLGDAPDSTNHASTGMTAYAAGPVMAHFPTVFGPGTAPVVGPNHWFPRADAWLGQRVSTEFDADLMPDEDGVLNIDPPADMPDRDRFDDGVVRRPALNHCKPAEMAVQVTVNPGAPVRDRFLNVWFDWNRDGDWEDDFDCANGASPEWAVQDFVTALGPGTHVITLPTFLPYNMGPNLDPSMDLWARVSIAEGKAPRNPTTGLADGRGPEKGYRFGETEDYHIFFQQQPDMEIHKSANVTQTVPGGIIAYQITIQNNGGATATAQHMEDAIPAGTVFVPGSLSASAGTATYDAGSNRIKWDGDVLAGTPVMVDFKVEVAQDQPPCDRGAINFAELYPAPGVQLTSQPVHVFVVCEPTTPTVTIEKMARITETVPGGIIHYAIKVVNTGAVTATGLHMEDPIPAATTYVSGSVTSTVPSASYDNSGHKVMWDGNLAPGATVLIEFEVKVTMEQPPCERGVINEAYVGKGDNRLTSNPVHVRVICDQPSTNMDFGDAPDSTNHYGLDNPAYPAAGVLGKFPTVWDSTPAGEGAGPAHQLSNRLWLGDRITPEKDADALPDADGVTNILDNGADATSADKDGADDGWRNPNVPIYDCTETTLVVRVRRSALPIDLNRAFLNVWYDGNRDGDWQDVRLCANSDQPGTTTGAARAFEWIVQDFIVDVTAIPASGFVDIAVPTRLIANLPNPGTEEAPAWMRFTLSERKAMTPAATGLADGRGPASPNQFALGETEDYIYQPPTSNGDPGVIELDKFVSGGPTTLSVGSVYTYSIDIKHVGGTAPALVAMTDVLPAEVHLVNGPFVTEVAPSVSPLVAGFDAGFGPSGRVGWQGHLTPDAAVRITFAVKVRRCPDTVTGAAPAIVNKALVLRPDGTIIDDTEMTPIDCQPQQPPQIELRKRILVEQTDDDGTVNTVEEIESSFFSGQQPLYGLFVHNLGSMTQTVTISDSLPNGLVAVNVSSNFGLAQIVDAGHGVIWTGNIGPANSPALIKIRVKPDGNLVCNRLLINKARWQIRDGSQGLSGESNLTRLYLACQDLGDAPDSTNHAGVGMDAYPGQPANFPTVFNVAAPERGPKHLEPRPFHLGRSVTAEREADTGFDMDPTNNILPRLNQADLDKRDDGFNPTTVAFTHCAINKFDVQVSITPSAIALLNAANDGIGYLNAWTDSNRDGDWDDTFDCPPDPETDLSFAQEHIVVDDPVNVAALGPGLHTISVSSTALVANPADMVNKSMWLRLTLSEQKSVKPFTGPGGPYGDGRGPDTGFRLGETEDYLLPPRDQQGEADPVVTKSGHLEPAFDPTNNTRFWRIKWLVNYANMGTAQATGVHVIDTFDAPQVLTSQHSVPHAPMTATGNSLDYNVGNLNAGATGSIVIQTAVPMTTAPGTILTNTVVINSGNDSNSLNNTAVATVTVPLLPPVIISPLPGTTCSSDITVTGRVQPGAVVDLYVDGSLHSTATPDSTGFWSVAVTGLADGSHSFYAVARVGSITSGPSATVVVIVDSTLFWDPLSLRFIEAGSGHVIVPSGRLDETGWSVFLKRGMAYTVTLRVCCEADNPVVTMELGDVATVNLTDPDGDHIYAGSFTTPADGPFAGTIRICVICELIKKCSDGEVTIDPEGNVYDLTTGAVLGGSTVACFQAVVSDAASDPVYDLWPALDFDQINPQTTAADGYFSFFTPPGSYQLQVAMSGYQPYRSWDLVVVDAPVHFDVPMTPIIAGDADHIIAITANGFEPAYLSVAPGDVIQWVNLDTGLHTSTSITPTVAFSGDTRALLPTDGWDSGLLDTGDSYERSLSAEGTYTYADHENPESTATIVVAQPAPEFKIYLPMVIR